MSVRIFDWVGRNNGPIFLRLWTKLTKFGRHVWGAIAVSNAVFRSTISCSLPEIFAIKSWSPKSRQNFDVFGLPNFWGEGPPNFWLNFITYSHHWTYGKIWSASLALFSLIWWRSIIGQQQAKLSSLFGTATKYQQAAAPALLLVLQDGRRSP